MLTINRTTVSFSDINACSQYTWKGQTYTQSGTYDYQTSNFHGCDSIATLRLNIYQPDVVIAQHSACDTYTWNGETYTQSGAYTYTTQNRFGCDSLTTLDLTIHIADSQNQQLTECDTIVYLGRTLSQSGIYTFELQNQFGCDSIITLALTISGNKIFDKHMACEQYLWPTNGETYTQTGIYTERYSNVLGCDSTYTLDLAINPDYEIITEAEACAQYLWPVTNQRYTQSGTYSFPLKTAQGCDSTLTLDLMIHPEFEFRDTVIASEPYLWPINDQTYETSGVYTEIFSTDISCDSIHYLYLTIKNTTDIFFPNIISPDGANGHFTGYSNNASVIIATLSIYDRWGNLLFTKENFPANDPQQGWDGKFGGRDVVPGVFTWLAVIKLKDGIATYSGDVTVVR
ncbi:MAG: gliding motility-associated C-terminal domain-containing protein [Saprospiraceae bacterium]|nr:gliding motility-associated C-terminal domain-containing protein [Saprospiraceae bacterium]